MNVLNISSVSLVTDFWNKNKNEDDEAVFGVYIHHAQLPFLHHFIPSYLPEIKDTYNIKSFSEKPCQ